MSIYNENQFILNKVTPTKRFTLKYPFSTILLIKVTLSSHIGNKYEEWGEIIRQIVLQFKSIQSEPHIENSHVLALVGCVSPNHIHPVFELNIELPQENIGKKEGLSPFFNEVEISIKEYENIDDNVTLTVFYESQPGLTEI